MRIALVLNSSWNLYNFRRGLIEALQQQGHTVVLIAPPDDYSERLQELGYELKTIAMEPGGINPLQDVKLMLRLYRLYRTIRPDAILHFTVKPNIYGTLAARLLRIPTINTVSGLGTVFLKSGWVSFIAQQLYRAAFRFPHRVFFHNPDDYQLFIAQRLISAEQGAVVPGSGIDLTRFAAESYPKKQQPFTFLLIARLLYDKGIEEYALAAQQLQQEGLAATFQLLGAPDTAHPRGIPKTVLNHWIATGIIIHLGTTDDVRPFIAQADAVVLPSYREGLPRTLLEAAAMQKPIVATNTPGCRQVVQDGYNGLLCRVRDAHDLAEKLRRMMRLDEPARQQMGERGRVLVAQFSEAQVIEHYLQALDSLPNRSLPLSGSR